MGWKLRLFAGRKASPCHGAARRAAGRRRLPASTILAAALVLALAPSAFASIGFVTKWGSQGSGDGQLARPYGVATDSSGNVYVADFDNSRVQKFSSSGTFLTKWGSFGSADGQFKSPAGIATDSSGNVYVADALKHQVQKFDSAGTFLTKWGSFGSADGQFKNPAGIAVDSSGNVYVADTANDRIQKFDSAGAFLTKWGSMGSGNGQVNDPADIATDSSGDVYVADTGNNRIQKFDSGGNFLAKWGHFGEAAGEFKNPAGIATDPSGDVYVADTGNNRIQKFASGGTLITKWGTSGSANGQFGQPLGVATDSSDNVYVADTDNNRIQVFHSSATPPDTLITGGPSGVTIDPSPTFTFTSPDLDTTFTCKLDSGPYTPCESPLTTSHLADGPHKLYVRAADPIGTDPSPASRTFSVRTAAVSVSGKTLVVTAAPGAKDNLVVTHPLPGTVRVTDLASGAYTGSGVHAGAGCTRSGENTAKCGADQVRRIQVSAGDQTDMVVDSTGFAASLFGGLASDTLVGGWGDDILTGGPGADAMKGMNGADQIFARDLSSDTSINCDGGSSPGHFDRANLDQLPKDPSSVVKGCESKTRH